MLNRVPSGLKILTWVLVALILTVHPIVMDLWLEHGSDKAYAAIEWIYDLKLPLISLLIPVIFFVFATVFIYRKMEQDRTKYEEVVNEQGQILIQKYHELREYQFKQVLSIALESFCKKHTEITAAQIYSYSKTSRSKSITVKVNYIDGFVKDHTTLNGMIQQYYEIDKKLYKNYHKSIRSFLDNQQKFIPILDFIIESKSHLDSIQVNDLTYKDSLIYSFMTDAYDLLLKHFPNTQMIYFETEKKERLEELNKKQRTGILRGIELELFYTFKYEGTGEKKGRQYITRPVTFQNDPHMLLITIDPDLLPESQELQNAQFEGLMDEFENILSETIRTKTSL